MDEKKEIGAPGEATVTSNPIAPTKVIRDPARPEERKQPDKEPGKE